MELKYEGCCLLMADLIKYLKKDYKASLKFCKNNEKSFVVISQKIKNYQAYMKIDKTKRGKKPPKPLKSETKLYRKYLDHYENIIQTEATLKSKDFQILTKGEDVWDEFVGNAREQANFWL